MIEQVENNEIVQVERLSFPRCLYLQYEQIGHLVHSDGKFFEHLGYAPINMIFIERGLFYESCHTGEYRIAVCRGKVIDKSQEKQRGLFN